MKFHEAREEYVRWLVATKDLSPHTVRAYQADIAALERHLGGCEDVGRIDRTCVIEFIEDQRHAGLCSRSIRRRASGVRGFCRWLLSRGLLESDPWVALTLSAGRARKLPRVLPAHELDRLLRWLRGAAGVDDVSASDPLDRPSESTTLLAVALMVATGARVSEVAGIRCRDVDLPERSIRIVGKGRRERHVFLTNDWICNLTVAYLATRLALGVQHPFLLFNSCGDPLTAPAIRARLVKARRSAAIETKVTPHMLRHTAATQLIEADVDIRYIQRFLGHTSLATTEIYTHVSDGALKRVVTNADVLGRYCTRDN